MISIESVQSKLLAGNVGYVRLKNFQGNTTRDLQAALSKLAAETPRPPAGLKGLVLDLRGNPGGLLEQAIQVTDLFVSQGTIVTTVAHDGKRRARRSRPTPTTPTINVPLAVLVNPGSASASEIVAGALKNLNRAVIIGQQTFGKGSVQVLYDSSPSGNPNDESALKLTIAKYLTPGRRLHPGGRHRAGHRAHPHPGDGGPGERLRAAQDHRARRTSSTTSATPPARPPSTKREEVLGREKPAATCST